MSCNETRSCVSQSNEFDQLQVTKVVEALPKRRESSAKTFPATSTPKPNHDSESDDILDLDCPESLIGSITPKEKSPSSFLRASENEHEQNYAEQAKK